MLTDDIDIVSENLTNRLENILRYSDFGKLSEYIGYLSGSLTLEKINQEITIQPLYLKNRVSLRIPVLSI